MYSQHEIWKKSMKFGKKGLIFVVGYDVDRIYGNDGDRPQWSDLWSWVRLETEKWKEKKTGYDLVMTDDGMSKACICQTKDSGLELS